MIYESVIELIEQYNREDKIDKIAGILYDSLDDDMFTDENDRIDGRDEAVARISNAIKSLPAQLAANAPSRRAAIDHQIAIVPIKTYDTEWIENDAPIAAGDEYTYRPCRKWKAFGFNIDSLDNIDEYLDTRSDIKSIPELSSVQIGYSGNNAFEFGDATMAPSKVYAVAPVIIDDSLDSDDKIAAVESVIDMIAIYGFDLNAGDTAKRHETKKIIEALDRADSDARNGKTYDADKSISEIMKAHGITPKPQEARERDSKIMMNAILNEFIHETAVVRHLIAPIVDEIRETAKHVLPN